MDKHEFGVIWNKGAIERCPVSDEEETFTGTDEEFMNFLDDNFVEVIYDEDDNMIDLDSFVKEYDDYTDLSGSTWLKKITKDGKVIFETKSTDEDENWNDDLDEGKQLTEDSKYNEFGLKEICPKCGGKNITFRDGAEYEDYYEAEAYCNDCKEVIDSTEVNYDDLDSDLTLEEMTVKKLRESVDWDYFNKFEKTIDEYMPAQGEGDTLASQIVTAVNKLVYKWYNDGDVYDNVHSGMNGWANDLSSYANWLDKYCDRAHRILDSIYNCFSESNYEDILKALADRCLDVEYLKTMEIPKQGSIYKCEGLFEFEEYSEEDDWVGDEEDW